MSDFCKNVPDTLKSLRFSVIKDIVLARFGEGRWLMGIAVAYLSFKKSFLIAVISIKPKNNILLNNSYIFERMKLPLFPLTSPFSYFVLTI